MKIVALGGGEKNHAGFSVKAAKIDKEIIRLTGKKTPKLLFVPTASSDSEEYVKDINKYFGNKFGCIIDVLYLLNKKISHYDIETKILSADIIYVGGGNTLKMLKLWRDNGIDKILKKASEKGIVLSGVSAGGICWFKFGSSDSRRFTNPNADLIRVTGLNWIPALFCPHYDEEKGRKLHVKKLMKRTPGVGIALDNYCAIEIIDNNYRIVADKKTANAYKVYWKKGKYNEELIEKKEKVQPLALLFNK